MVVHIHLKAPIVFGKREAHVSGSHYLVHASSSFTVTQDAIQIFREASDVQFKETGNRKRKHRHGDEDEIEMEQQERKRMQMFNKEFKLFAERVQRRLDLGTLERFVAYGTLTQLDRLESC